MVFLRTDNGTAELGRMHDTEAAFQEMGTGNLSDEGKTMLL